MQEKGVSTLVPSIWWRISLPSNRRSFTWQKKRKVFFKRLVSGLAKTRDNIVAGFDSIFSGFSSIDEDFYEELEEILIMGDIGINATTSIIENLKKEVSERHIKEPMECKTASDQ